MDKHTADARVKRALELFREDENQEAIEILEAEDLQANADALLLLGQIYNATSKSSGGVSRNTSKARQYWLKAFELGNTEAARELADMYYFGEGVKENYRKAEYYWKSAAVAGDEIAQFELANYYYDYVPDKINNAIELYKLLIDRDEFVGNSCLKLGRIYYRGIGVPRDTDKAFYWLTKGAELGDGNSCMDLAYIYYRGDGTEKNVDKAIALVEAAGQTEWLKDDAPQIAELMRKGTLFH